MKLMGKIKKLQEKEGIEEQRLKIEDWLKIDLGIEEEN